MEHNFMIVKWVWQPASGIYLVGEGGGQTPTAIHILFEIWIVRLISEQTPDQDLCRSSKCHNSHFIPECLTATFQPQETKISPTSHVTVNYFMKLKFNDIRNVCNFLLSPFI